MAREIFEVTKDRFHLQDPCCYILQGTWPKEAKMRAKLDRLRAIIFHFQFTVFNAYCCIFA